jgi:heme/copper-type cytochrome/quinol oxidase subunit 2
MNMQGVIEILGPEATGLLVGMDIAIVLLYGAWFIRSRQGRISPAQVRRNQAASGWPVFVVLLMVMCLFIRHQTILAQAQGQSNITPDVIIANIEAQHESR